MARQAIHRSLIHQSRFTIVAAALGEFSALGEFLVLG
jgi:hypothetical protein